jgi:hypothetical protein
MDSLKCQTPTASPAKPGELSYWFRRYISAHKKVLERQRANPYTRTTSGSSDKLCSASISWRVILDRSMPGNLALLVMGVCQTSLLAG